MSTNIRRDAREDQHLGNEISILCRETPIGTKCTNFYSSILGTNIFPSKDSVATCRNYMQDIWNSDTQDKAKAHVAWDKICA